MVRDMRLSLTRRMFFVICGQILAVTQINEPEMGSVQV